LKSEDALALLLNMIIVPLMLLGDHAADDARAAVAP
jgi:hypothetical protein